MRETRICVAAGRVAAGRVAAGRVAAGRFAAGRVTARMERRSTEKPGGAMRGKGRSPMRDEAEAVQHDITDPTPLPRELE